MAMLPDEALVTLDLLRQGLPSFEITVSATADGYRIFCEPLAPVYGGERIYVNVFELTYTRQTFTAAVEQLYAAYVNYADEIEDRVGWCAAYGRTFDFEAYEDSKAEDTEDAGSDDDS